MGFDLNGMKPKANSEKGTYFRNNVWWWRPLWNFVSTYCDDILTETDIEMGSSNDCHKISKAKADKIAQRLNDLIDSGEVIKYEKQYRQHLDSLNDNDWNKNYPFDIRNVRDFADFCADSGGFIIG